MHERILRDDNHKGGYVYKLVYKKNHFLRGYYICVEKIIDMSGEIKVLMPYGCELVREAGRFSSKTFRKLAEEYEEKVEFLASK